MGKYPPIEGQVSTLDYWLARGLAERGHTVMVITNADEAEAECRVVRGDDYDSWRESRMPESGGRVRVLATAPFDSQQFYVPPANPFVTKLAALAITAARDHGAELLFSTYLEPYAVAAHLAASCIGIPHVATHSGSDIARLARNPHLQPLYLEVIGASIFVAKNRLAAQLAEGATGPPVRPRPYWPPETIFNPAAPPLDVNAFLLNHRAAVRDELLWHTRHFDPARFTFGLYGKLAEAKGIYDLIAALALLKADGLPFNVLIMSRWRTGEERLRASIRDGGLDDDVWLLPFVPNWDVPSFVRACDAVCHLERQWPTGEHVSIVPKEVAACGTCLVISEEVRRKPAFGEILDDGKTCVAVEDPLHTETLAAALGHLVEEPERAREIGKAANSSVRRVSSHGEFIASWEAVLSGALRRSRCAS